ncbi:DNA polymerase I, partial [Monoraphidium neglectum]
MLQPHRHPIGRRLYLIDAKAQVYRLSHGYGDAATAPPPAPQAGPGSGSGGGSGEESSLVAHGSVLFPQYKAQRSAAPQGLKEDLGRILDVVDALGVPILTVPGVEADDVIGTLAARGADHGLDVTIVSPDKDFFQVLRPRVRLLRLIKAPKKVAVAPGSIFYTEADFEAEHQLGDARLWAD